MMRSLLCPALALLSVGVAKGFDVDGCTSIAVGNGATVDGSAMSSHSNDCVDCDWRMVYVPAKDHKKDNLRPVLDACRSAYPRIVDPSRSPQYQPGAGIDKSLLLGYIPQVEHTYALYESTYSLMNEKGVTVGESTCSAFLVGNGTKGNPKVEKVHSYANDGSLFSIGSLISIALERCETARCAVKTMGELGAKYGFYGEDPGQAGAGEAATVADMSGETWVFHISGGLPEAPGSKYEGQRGALWAAQRVPDGHVAVIANNFIIRDVRPEDTDNFIVHPGLLELAEEAGLWDGEGVFDFLRMMSPDVRYFSYTAGIPPIPLYTTLRMWHVFNSVAPSLRLKMTDNPWEYPFSVPVDKKVTHLDVMNLFRTHYEGTEFDMRLGAIAGPWMSPNRAEGGAGLATVKGQVARSTSIMRTSYTQVGQTGIKHPKMWFAPDMSTSSVFVPFYASVLADADGHFDVASYGEGSQKSFDFSAPVKPAWWAFDFVANWMEMSYQNMSETYVYPKVQKMQREVNDAAMLAEKKAHGAASAKVAKELAAEQFRIQRWVSQEWWELAGMLVVRYNDFFFNYPESNNDKVFTIGYPAWWLEMVGFGDRSFFPNWVAPSNLVPNLLPAKDLPAAISGLSARLSTTWGSAYDPVVALQQAAWSPAATSMVSPCVLAFGMMLAGVIGYRLGKQASKDKEEGAYLRMAA